MDIDMKFKLEKQTFLYKILDSIPPYIREEYPKFTDFIMTYYKYMESNKKDIDENGQEIGINGVYDDLIRFNENIRGIREDKDYISKFIKELGFDLNVNLNLYPDLQYKIINDFLQMRGSESSVKLLFRLLFNADVDIEYPRDKLLYLSQATYNKNHFLILKIDKGVVIPTNISFASLIGLNSKTTATIEYLDIIYTNEGKYLLIECSSLSDTTKDNSEDFISGDFELNEIIKILYDRNKSIDTLNVGVYDVNLKNPNNRGNGYRIGDVVSITNCKQQGVGYISSITKGSIEKINIVNGGIGYEKGDVIRATNGFHAIINKVDVNGSVENIYITNGGYNYNKYPNFDIYSEYGDGLIIKPFGKNVGSVAKISFKSPFALCSNISKIEIESQFGFGFDSEVFITTKIQQNKHSDKVGFLSINNILLDSDINQEYSYRLSSKIHPKEYKSIIDEYTHPFGFIREDVISTEYELDFNLNENKQDGFKDFSLDVLSRFIHLKSKSLGGEYIHDVDLLHDVIINDTDIEDINIGEILEEFEINTYPTYLENTLSFDYGELNLDVVITEEEI